MSGGGDSDDSSLLWDESLFDALEDCGITSVTLSPSLGRPGSPSDGRSLANALHALIADTSSPAEDTAEEPCVVVDRSHAEQGSAPPVLVPSRTPSSPSPRPSQARKRPLSASPSTTALGQQKAKRCLQRIVENSSLHECDACSGAACHVRVAHHVKLWVEALGALSRHGPTGPVDSVSAACGALVSREGAQAKLVLRALYGEVGKAAKRLAVSKDALTLWETAARDIKLPVTRGQLEVKVVSATEHWIHRPGGALPVLQDNPSPSPSSTST